MSALDLDSDTLPPDWKDSGPPRSVNGKAAALRLVTEPLPLVPPDIGAPVFPLDALGATLAVAARAIADAVQCPDAIAGQCVLSAASLAVQGHYDAFHPVSGAAPSSLHFVTLADSGERKTTADKLALRRVYEVQAAGRDFYNQARAAWHNECEAREAERRRIKTAAGKKGEKPRGWAEIKSALDDVGADPHEPISPNRLVSDPTAEGFFKHAVSAHGSLLWANNEAGQVLGGVAMSEDNRLRLVSMLSLLWDGQPIDRIRAGDGASTLNGRRLALHWMAQPEIAANFLSDPIMRAQGVLSRFLITRPQSRIGSRPFRDRPGDLEARLAPYEDRLEVLLGRNVRCGARENELRPDALPWAPDAEHVWRGFHDHVEREMGDEGELVAHRGFGSKLAENAARIATTLQAFNDETPGRVRAAAMAQAIKIAEYYLAETIRLRALAGWDESLQRAEKVREWIANPLRCPDQHVSVRDLQNSGPNAVRDKKLAEQAIKTLQEYGHLAPNAEIIGRKKAYRILTRRAA